MIYTGARSENGQCLLDFTRKDTVIFTSLSLGGPVDWRLMTAGKTPPVELRHGRRWDELAHRADVV